MTAKRQPHVRRVYLPPEDPEEESLAMSLLGLAAVFHLFDSPLQISRPYESYMGCLTVPRRVVEEWQREGLIESLPETRDVRPFLAETSVYVLPSYHEGMPRTVLEAMSMGRPIITTDASGCRETVIEGRNGYIVPVKDSRALSEAMERFLIDPPLISAMGRQSRLVAEERFDVRKVNSVILSRLGIP